MSLLEAHNLFNHKLGTSLNRFLDGFLMACLGKPVINIFKFDEWLHEQFGQYEEQGLSMHEVMEKQYGADVTEQLEELFK